MTPERQFKLVIKMILANLLAVAIAVVGVFFPAVKPVDNTVMIGHRGLSGLYPENTALSFQKAAEKGFGGAETDVRMTKDGVFVTSHDDTITLKDGSTMVISESTYEDLTKQPLQNKKTKDDVYLTTFKQYLEIMRDNNMVCFIELKGAYTDAQINDIFTLAGNVYTLDMCILQSFNFDNLVKAKQQFPEMRSMLTYGTTDTDYEKCFEYGISIDANVNNLTKEMIKEFHDRGLEAAVYTANDPFTRVYCKSLGVDYIESDYFGK